MENRDDKLRPFVSMALQNGADDALVIETSTVVTEPWVRTKCQFGCRWYGAILCCPPQTPTPDEMRRILDSYTYAILAHCNWKGEDTEPRTRFNDMIVDVETELFFKGYYKAWGLGSGPCKRCEKCHNSSPCVNPQRARPSMEACGIEVFKTARYHGLPIHTIIKAGDPKDIYGIILVE